MLQAVAHSANPANPRPVKKSQVSLNLIAFCRTSNGNKWIILQRRPKLVTLTSGGGAKPSRVSGPQKDQLQLFRQEFDGVQSHATIAALAKRFYRGRLSPDLLQKAFGLNDFSNEKRATFVFPFVIPSEHLYFDGHLYEPAPIKDIPILIEGGEIHESSAGLLGKANLDELYSIAYATTPPLF